MADLDRYSKSDLGGCRNLLPPLPLLTKEGIENREKLPARFGEEPNILALPLIEWVNWDQSFSERSFGGEICSRGHCG